MILESLVETETVSGMGTCRVLDDALVACVHVIGASGSGKTSLVAGVAPHLAGSVRMALITAGSLPEACQRVLDESQMTVLRVRGEHGLLTPAEVRRSIERLPLHELDLVFIETTAPVDQGTLGDLGERARLCVLNAEEGLEQIGRHRCRFRGPSLIAVTKCDRVPAAEAVRLAKAIEALRRANPCATVVCTSIVRPAGIEETAGWVQQMVYDPLCLYVG